MLIRNRNFPEGLLVIRALQTGVYEGKRYGVYEIVNGNTVVGTIEGRFPEHQWPKRDGQPRR